MNKKKFVIGLVIGAIIGTLVYLTVIRKHVITPVAQAPMWNCVDTLPNGYKIVYDSFTKKYAILTGRSLGKYYSWIISDTTTYPTYIGHSNYNLIELDLSAGQEDTFNDSCSAKNLYAAYLAQEQKFLDIRKGEHISDSLEQLKHTYTVPPSFHEVPGDTLILNTTRSVPGDTVIIDSTLLNHSKLSTIPAHQFYKNVKNNIHIKGSAKNLWRGGIQISRTSLDTLIDGIHIVDTPFFHITPNTTWLGYPEKYTPTTGNSTGAIQIFDDFPEGDTTYIKHTPPPIPGFYLVQSYVDTVQIKVMDPTTYQITTLPYLDTIYLYERDKRVWVHTSSTDSIIWQGLDNVSISGKSKNIEVSNIVSDSLRIFWFSPQQYIAETEFPMIDYNGNTVPFVDCLFKGKRFSEETSLNECSNWKDAYIVGIGLNKDCTYWTYEDYKLLNLLTRYPFIFIDPPGLPIF